MPNRSWTIGQFTAERRVSLSAEHIGGLVIGDTHHLTVFVNRTVRPGDPTARVLRHTTRSPACTARTLSPPPPRLLRMDQRSVDGPPQLAGRRGNALSSRVTHHEVPRPRGRLAAMVPCRQSTMDRRRSDVDRWRLPTVNSHGVGGHYLDQGRRSGPDAEPPAAARTCTVRDLNAAAPTSPALRDTQDHEQATRSPGRPNRVDSGNGLVDSCLVDMSTVD